jgi:hypothetical protein
MRRVSTRGAVCAATAVLGLLGIAGCTTASATSTARTASTASTARADTVTGFVGYHWQVVTIAHDGPPTPIPAGDLVYLDFARNGQFGANDPINIHDGTYRSTSDGFVIVGPVGASGVGSTGDNPVTTLAIDAIAAFEAGVRATTTVSGDRLTVTADGYRFDCLRDGTG